MPLSERTKAVAAAAYLQSGARGVQEGCKPCEGAVRRVCEGEVNEVQGSMRGRTGLSGAVR